MMKVFKLFSGRFVMVPILAAMLLIVSCNKNDNNNNRGPVAGLMTFNLAPDQENVAFTISNNYLGNSTLGYTSYSGSYLPVYVGDREVRSLNYSTGSTLAIAQKAFMDSNYYSVFLLGYKGGYRNTITTDTLASLAVSPGKAWVRYVNAIADSTVTSTVNIADGTETTINESAAYGAVSGFKQVSAGTVSTTINSSAFSTTRDINLEENKVYTVLFVGDPTLPSDEVKKVQVKFIVNGTLTP